MENKSEKRSVVITGGAFGAMLSGVIIAARAFQPNAIPMGEWSIWSWFLMLLPMYWPFAVFLAFYVLKFIVLIFDSNKRTI